MLMLLVGFFGTLDSQIFVLFTGCFCDNNCSQAAWIMDRVLETRGQNNINRLGTCFSMIFDHQSRIFDHA